MMNKMQKQNPGTSAALFQRRQIFKMWAKCSHEVKQMYKAHEMRTNLAMQQQTRRNFSPGAMEYAPPPEHNLRSGMWTLDEEVFAKVAIKYFEQGLLNLETGGKLLISSPDQSELPHSYSFAQKLSLRKASL
jgi:hypothetical protein